MSGKVVYICISPQAGEPMQAVHEVEQADCQDGVVQLWLAPAGCEDGICIRLGHFRGLQRELAALDARHVQRAFDQAQQVLAAAAAFAFYSQKSAPPPAAARSHQAPFVSAPPPSAPPRPEKRQSTIATTRPERLKSCSGRIPGPLVLGVCS